MDRATPSEIVEQFLDCFTKSGQSPFQLNTQSRSGPFKSSQPARFKPLLKQLIHPQTLDNTLKWFLDKNAPTRGMLWTPSSLNDAKLEPEQSLPAVNAKDCQVEMVWASSKDKFQMAGKFIDFKQ